MGYITTNYQIAAGHNNAGGLVLITALTDGTNTFVEPTSIFTLNRGRREVRLNGVVGRAGYPKVTLFSDLLYTQWVYLVDNFEGLVTVKIPYLSTSFTNFNATLSLADPEEMTEVSFAASYHEAGFQGPGFQNAPWALTRLVAL